MDAERDCSCVSNGCWCGLTGLCEILRWNDDFKCREVEYITEYILQLLNRLLPFSSFVHLACYVYVAW